MGNDITAKRISDDTIVADISFGYGSLLNKEFFHVMGVNGDTVFKVYTVTELKKIRKSLTKIITNDSVRKEVRHFLNACINANESLEITFL